MKEVLQELLGFRKMNELKQVYRLNSCGPRKESSAEHSWSAEMLARYIFLIADVDPTLNKEKVLELLAFHDVVEIESGDTPFHPNKSRGNQKEKEWGAAKVLKELFPPKLGEKFFELFSEFEEQKTKEAKYAKAIDSLDALIHELDYPADWKDWSRQFLVDHKGKYFGAFPELSEIFYGLLDYLERNKYFH